MSANTKIVVLKMKELIYTAIFVGLAILLVAIGWAMFQGGDSNSEGKQNHQTAPSSHGLPTDVDTSANTDIHYIPGIYTASLPLSNQSVDVEVIVDTNQIKSIRLVDLQESVAAMYPLMEPTMNTLQSQILTSQSIDGVTYDAGSKYTAYVLLQAVQSALEKAITE